MKACVCGAVKWKGRLSLNWWQCLKCYRKYTTAQLKRLKDKATKSQIVT